jgi:hypothetical protein
MKAIICRTYFATAIDEKTSSACQPEMRGDSDTGAGSQVRAGIAVAVLSCRKCHPQCHQPKTGRRIRLAHAIGREFASEWVALRDTNLRRFPVGTWQRQGNAPGREPPE